MIPLPVMCAKNSIASFLFCEESVRKAKWVQYGDCSEILSQCLQQCFIATLRLLNFDSPSCAENRM